MLTRSNISAATGGYKVSSKSQLSQRLRSSALHVHCILRSMALVLACALLGCRPATSPVAAPDFDAQVINPQLTRAMLTRGDGSVLLWGSDGSILRSLDGLRWDATAAPTDSDVIDIAADDANLLVAVGKQGV